MGSSPKHLSRLQDEERSHQLEDTDHDGGAGDRFEGRGLEEDPLQPEGEGAIQRRDEERNLVRDEERGERTMLITQVLKE